MSYFGTARRQPSSKSKRFSLFGNSDRKTSRQRKKSAAINERNTRNRQINKDSSFFPSVDWDRFRFRMVAVFFCLVWGTLWLRVGCIQLWDGPELADKARRQHISAERVDVPRGMICDRNGQILARSVEVCSVYANPSQIDDVDAVAKKLASILGRSPQDISASLQKNRSFIWIARRIDDATAEAVRKADLRGIELIREQERIYPYKHVAGQLIGFVGMDGRGLEGLERSFDDELSGLPVRQMFQRDASGRLFYMDNNDDEMPESEDLRLTIDVQVQFMAEEVLSKGVEEVAAKWGGMLIVDVQNGNVLAWAQYPFFNPNVYRKYKPAEYRNRLALDALEPGSTFKPFLVASALQEGVVTRNTVFNCENGVWKTKRSVIRDDNRAYKDLSVNQILMYSSNIGCGKIGLTLGAVKFHKYLSLLGFGQRMGLHLNESKGILRSPKDWSESDLISTSFGQSVSVTEAQMAQAYLTLANGGVYKPLRILLDSEEDDGGGQRVFSAETSREVLRIMQDVVDAGTGKKAAVPGMAVAGKTGTAQKAKSGTYGKERTASFVGLIPADKPLYLVVIFIDEPVRGKYGGTIAAPLFKNVITRVMAYQGALPDPGAQLAQRVKRQEERAAKRAKRQKQKQEETIMGEVRRELASAAPTIKPKEKGAVPDVVGQSLRRAVEMFVQQGLVPVIKGDGARVVRQEPIPGIRWSDKNQAPRDCVLWLSES